MPSRVTVAGLDALVSLLARAETVARDWAPLRRAVALEAQRRARAGVRRRTGRLAASITVDDTGAVAHVGTDLVYAWPVHAGVPRRHIAPTRYLLPLAYEIDPTQIFEQVMGEALK